MAGTSEFCQKVVNSRILEGHLLEVYVPRGPEKGPTGLIQIGTGPRVLHLRTRVWEGSRRVPGG